MGAIRDNIPNPIAAVYAAEDLLGWDNLNKPLLIATAVSGLVSWTVCSAAYGLLVGVAYRPLLIGALFAFLMCALSSCIVLLGKKMNTFEANVLTHKPSRPSMLAALLAGTVALFGAATLFEWIYEVQIEYEEYDPTSYVFVIDDSGSMESNDPGQSRFSAIGTVVEGSESALPYAVYSFSDDVSCLREMAPSDGGQEPLIGKQDGGTSLRKALDAVLADYSDGVLGGGEHPRVVLLSDGVPTDMLSFAPMPELRQFVASGISISTVGLGDDDEALMRRIAQATGGAYVNSPDAEGLAEAMSSAAVTHANRDLLSERFCMNWDWVYAVMRTAFLLIIGCIVGALAALAYGSYDSLRLIIVSSLVQSLVGSLIMELGVGLIGLPAWLCWLALWILFATTLALYPMFVIGARRKNGRLFVLVPSPSWSIRRKNINPSNASR